MGYLGLLAGFGLIYGINYLLKVNELELEFFRDPQVNFTVVLAALILLVLNGVWQGLFPALRALKINPVIAMKS